LPNVGGANLAGDSISNSIEPIAKQVRPAQGRSLPQQDKKGRLEGVLDVLLTPEDTPADPRHHAPVPPHDRREGTGILARQVIAQQALVGRFTFAAWAGNVLHGAFNLREASPSIALTGHWFYAPEGGEGSGAAAGFGSFDPVVIVAFITGRDDLFQRGSRRL
jgi:hypothetical protein